MYLHQQIDHLQPQLVADLINIHASRQEILHLHFHLNSVHLGTIYVPSAVVISNISTCHVVRSQGVGGGFVAHLKSRMVCGHPAAKCESRAARENFEIVYPLPTASNPVEFVKRFVTGCASHGMNLRTRILYVQFWIYHPDYCSNGLVCCARQ